MNLRDEMTGGMETVETVTHTSQSSSSSMAAGGGGGSSSSSSMRIGGGMSGGMGGGMGGSSKDSLPVLCILNTDKLKFSR